MEQKLYQCINQVMASPMTRGEYIKYRGWEVPADEDPLDAGYLVEYVGDSQANHPNHVGYISWSPKKVFASCYANISSPQARVQLEHDQVDQRLDALVNLLSKGCPDYIPELQWELMTEQLQHQQNYASILRKRLDLFNAVEA